MFQGFSQADENAPLPNRNRALRVPRPPQMAFAACFLVLVVAVCFALIFNSLYPGQDQPVPFSHRIHVSTKQLSCFFCHPNAANSQNPGMPPVEKCLLCHDVIASNFFPIARIREYGREGKGIPWKRVNKLPDFVHFSHQAHIARGFDCGTCHGDVKEMDRVKEVYEFDMNFCIDCHWRYNAPDSCFTCHY